METITFSLYIGLPVANECVFDDRFIFIGEPIFLLIMMRNGEVSIEMILFQLFFLFLLEFDSLCVAGENRL